MIRKLSNTNIFAIVVLLLALSGCNRIGYDYTDLKGKVTVDGVVLTEGSLAFFPEDSGKGKGVFVQIGTNGLYNAPKVPLGKTRITVTAMKKSGKKINVFDREMDEMISVIPEQYKSGILIDISSGQTELNIELNSN
jgi:hypothetical protein